jgi:hypothetical protein
MIPNFQLLHQPLHKNDELGRPSSSLPTDRQADVDGDVDERDVVERRQRKQISELVLNNVGVGGSKCYDDNDDDVGGSLSPVAVDYSRTGRPNNDGITCHLADLTGSSV